MNSNFSADAIELKMRLQWGQPAFTIIDVRDRSNYNLAHIVGAIPLPLDNLASRAHSTLQRERDIYIYGNDDAQSAYAAQILRISGFTSVCELTGGITAWENIGGTLEGTTV